MKALLVIVLVVALCCGSTLAAKPANEWLGQAGLGFVGSLLGTVVAVTAISNIAPQIESDFNRTALVIGSLTVFDGLGAAAGVLAAGKIWNIDGNIGGCILGGLAGGLASAFVEPLLYLLGVPEGWTEFFGMALLPTLPALGAVLGFGY